MNTRVKSLITPIIVTFVIFVVASYCIIQPHTFDDYSSCVSYAISGVTILFLLYEKFLWRFIPWNRPPVLKNEYDGVIEYVREKQSHSKEIKISVKQTLLTIRITTKTDINSSRALTGEIVEEHGTNILYYSYITNPSAQCRDDNPIQYGTCRMELSLDDRKTMIGHYWTSANTTGDIIWKEKD